MKIKTLLVALAVLLVSIPMSAQRSGTNSENRRRPEMKKEMCLQLYSIRDLIGDAGMYAKNHVEVFKQLKAMGYSSVEAASYGDGKFYGVSPEQFKKDCEDAGLVALSSHATRGLNDQELASHDFTEAMKWWDQAIKAHKAAGMTYLVSPWMNMPKTLKEAQTICDYHDAVGKKCREAGLLYGYHTHSGEYQKVDGQVWVDYMMKHIDAANMFWQMDVYWCVMAQQSPVEWFKKYPGRFTMLHIKDKYELGESGMIGFDAIFNHAGLAGLKDYVVEMEDTDGSISIMEGVKRSAQYLLSSRFVKYSYSQK